MRKTTTLAIVSLAMFCAVYICASNVSADNPPAADDHHHAKVMHFQNVEGDTSRVEAETAINKWLADPKNKAQEPTVLFCYNPSDGTLLVTIIWKYGVTPANPYKVKMMPIVSRLKGKKGALLEDQLNTLLSKVTMRRLWQETGMGRGMIFVVYQEP